ncbi:uncharacterized protein [Ptychodera flava]|uniref:uncharacterized protein n=1 Tax=Ptychodera flava TaxID=63121 RepID=UPI00396A2E4F
MAEGGEENIPLQDFDDANLNDDDATAETFFIDDDNALAEADPFLASPKVDRLTELRADEKLRMVNKFLKENKITDPDALNVLAMESEIRDGKLYYKNLKLSKDRGGGFYKLATLRSEKGGHAFIREVLGGRSSAEPEFVSRTLYSEDVKNNKIPAEKMTPEDMGIYKDELTFLRQDASGNADKIQAFENKIEQWNNLNPEYRAINDELSIANMRISDLNNEKVKIRLEKREVEKQLKEIPEEHTQAKEKAEKLLAELITREAKIDNRIEYENGKISGARESLATTRSLRDVISDPELSLRLKLTELFKRNGITIAAILTALGMTISTIALAVTKGGGGGGGTGANTGGSGPPKVYTKAKEIVKQFGEWLKTLAAKSAAAIPGLIGSLVSFLLKTAGSVVGFVGEQLWIFLTGLTLVIINKIMY